jgi:hypothetical protein
VPQIATASLAAALLPLACSSTTESGTLQLVTGQETDTYSQLPVPASLEVDSIDSSGNATQVATASLPANAVDLGSFDPTAAGIIQVSAFTAPADAGATVGNRVLAGQSIVVLFGDLSGATLPVFIQRTREMARLPNPPSDSRALPVVGVIEGRYVVVTGGGAATDGGLGATTMVYDLGSFSQVSPAITLPIIPTSMAFVGFVGWLVNDVGVYQYDFSSGTSTSVTLPSGASFLDIAGGATVSAPDGSQYIVGATRTTGAPTQAVLALDSSGNPSWLTLADQRLGAAATWLPSLGLVVTGGSPTAPGAEVIAVASTTGASTGSTYAYPPDPSIGAGAAALDGTHVLVAGGTLQDGTTSAGVHLVDLSCTSACLPAPWAPLDATITGAQVFAINSSSAVVVGSEPPSSTTPGLTHVYQVTSSASIEVPTKVVHTQAAAIASPIGVVGSVLLFGGAPAIESLGL